MASLQAAATLMQPAKLVQLRKPAAPLAAAPGGLSKAFGVESSGARLTCSLQSEVKDFAQRCADAAKIAGFALATSALVASGAANAEGVPKRLTFDEIQSKTYMEVKGTGTANQCPTIEGGVDGFPFKAGKYNLKKFCLEPTSFTVKAEGVSKNSAPEFQKTKLMTRLTYTLDEIEGPLEVSSDGSIKFEEKDGIDYAAVTVQLPGGERVPFLFTVKQLVATGTPDKFGGSFLVPSYRGSSFLDPKGRGGSVGLLSLSLSAEAMIAEAEQAENHPDPARDSTATGAKEGCLQSPENLQSKNSIEESEMAREEPEREGTVGKRRERENENHSDPGPDPRADDDPRDPQSPEELRLEEGAREEEKRENRGERKGDLFLQEAKRRRVIEESAEDGDDRGEGSSSFSFSIGAANFPAQTINTTPKFGSFNFFAAAEPSSSQRTAAAKAPAAELVHGQNGDSTILSHEVEL